jgi:uncharacterized membrane protein YfcA/uncharacterized membrane protein
MDRIANMEILVSNVLRGGVIVSSAVVVLGLVYQLFSRSFGLSIEPRYPDTLGRLVGTLLHAQPLGVIVLGLALLSTTPILRVAISILGFAAEGDRLYVLITGVVLVILLSSVIVVGGLLGRGAHEWLVNRDPLAFFLIFGGSILAGFVGSLVGLGGGVFVVPLLTIGFGVPIQDAIGASIVSVIATSSGAAAAYVRDRLTNLRIGMFLEVATTIGAISGAVLAAIINSKVLFVVFGLVLIFSALPLIRDLGQEVPQGVQDDRFSKRLKLASSYPDRRLGEEVPYEVTGVPAGFSMMYVAGLISGLLGIGSGTFKVLAMDTAMHLPMKVSTTTSNFMIGVTAAASAGIYFQRGDINPLIAAPVALGVLLGAAGGAVTLPRMTNTSVRKLFLPLILAVGAEMLLRAAGIL